MSKMICTYKKLCKIDVSISIGVKDLEDVVLEHLDVGGGLGVAARQVLDLVLLQPVRPVHLVAVAVPELTNPSFTFIIYLVFSRICRCNLTCIKK